MKEKQRESGLEYMRSEIETAIQSLASLFPITPKELQSFEMPGFDFDEVSEGYFDEDSRSGRKNIILMLPKGITNYGIGRVVGVWFYFNINPQIFQELYIYAEKVNPFKKTAKGLERRSIDSSSFRMLQGYHNLMEVIRHYSGLDYNQKGVFPSENASDLIKKEMSEEKPLEKKLARLKIGGMYMGRKIAENLYHFFTSNEFKPLARLPFEEARERLRLLTGIDLLDKPAN